jgi:hypothetical protein
MARICERLDKPWRTMTRLLEALHVLRLVTVRREEITEEEEIPGKHGQPPQKKTRKTGKYRYFYQLTERSCEGVKALQ